MALTANRDVDHYVDQELRSFRVAAAEKIFKGALVGLSSGGFARSLTAGDPFAGIAFEEMDNTTGADGDVSVRVYTLGDFGLTLTGATVADVGRPVFASSDDTLSFTGTTNSYVGVVQDFVTTDEIILRMDPGGKRIKTVTHAVEDLAAGADLAARAVHHFNSDGWIVAARVVNQATPAVGIDNSNTCVLALAIGASTIVTATFDATTTFPPANTAGNLGALGNTHAPSGGVIMLTVTNGVTADPGPFLVEVDYV